MDPLKIRQFIFPNDYPAVYHLWSSAGPGIGIGRSDTEAEIAKKVARDPDLFLLAEIDGELAGTVIGGFDGRRGMMYHLAVAENHRRKGIASALLKELERRLEAKGCLKYYFLVKQGNDSAREFYEQHGCKPMDITIYGKELGTD